MALFISEQTIHSIYIAQTNHFQNSRQQKKQFREFQKIIVARADRSDPKSSDPAVIESSEPAGPASSKFPQFTIGKRRVRKRGKPWFSSLWKKTRAERDIGANGDFWFEGPRRLSAWETSLSVGDVVRRQRRLEAKGGVARQRRRRVEGGRKIDPETSKEFKEEGVGMSLSKSSQALDDHRFR